MKRVHGLIVLCALCSGDTVRHPDPPPRRESDRERLIQICVNHPEAPVRRFGRLLEQGTFALVTDPALVTLPRLGFGLSRPAGHELSPTLYVRPEHLASADAFMLQFELVHEVWHCQQLFSALATDDPHLEDWLTVVDTPFTIERAERHFRYEVEAYYAGALFALSQGRTDVHSTVETVARGGLDALARLVAIEYIAKRRYNPTGEGPVSDGMVHAWAIHYSHHQRRH